MKTNKNTRQHRQTRTATPRPAPLQHYPDRPPARRAAGEFLDFCLYPGMKPAEPITYPTAV